MSARALMRRGGRQLRGGAARRRRRVAPAAPHLQRVGAGSGARRGGGHGSVRRHVDRTCIFRVSRFFLPLVWRRHTDGDGYEGL